MTAAPAFQWLGADQLHPAPPAVLADWLFDSGSLTRRLTALSAGRFAVTPLAEGWQVLRDDECTALDVVPGSTGWVREVYLLGAERPWVFARSVAAREALAGFSGVLAELGRRPLGELLFSDPAFARGPLQATHYPPDWLPAGIRCPGLWGRRSRFHRETLSVLVAEVFLPELWRYQGIDPDTL
ncbi:Chorismate lyase [Azotobacter vinelandii CA]|uniref:Probable chorismate pyruvate-lyase n=2 Tax=Azotobacter vinelandii TaxID=354 RepID=C1DK46_AZOVD|nr:chorismate lyase [Azotobacter vinelandii]ACO80951.1 Chorismate lyase [Azotobacter vinelandii DJ]AGK14055.1 Chorismate lyase [Azotobacter vinelandii CA]AGK18928.1 Chorismate lyase [Azotobacter vinelandii CA6]SFW99527.1 chorismate lyase [Azotobacter vinelandii]GLK60575.1 putative chorismate pyruvate-lyase [Azotobacter vinelandii]